MERRRGVTSLIILFAAAFVVATVVVAGNQWVIQGFGVHWDKTNLSAWNDGTGHFGSIIGEEIGDWGAGTCFNMSGGGPSGYDFRAFERNAGATGWLGLATIENYNIDVHGLQIVQARTELNTYYLNDPFYNDDWDRHVACQEIGHDIGLDHGAGLLSGPRPAQRASERRPALHTD